MPCPQSYLSELLLSFVSAPSTGCMGSCPESARECSGEIFWKLSFFKGKNAWTSCLLTSLSCLSRGKKLFLPPLLRPPQVIFSPVFCSTLYCLSFFPHDVANFAFQEQPFSPGMWLTALYPVLQALWSLTLFLLASPTTLLPPPLSH